MGQVKGKKLELKGRRGTYLEVNRALISDTLNISDATLSAFEKYDLAYRSLCGILFNFVPTSGHPGGSISSGRIVSSLLFNTMQYNMSEPDDDTADLITYAAGHKAMGLYAMWALRNEVLKQYDSSLLPHDIRKQMRLEDLLGFRRNPTQATPLFKEYNAKPLDGHPSPLVPFVKLATGASGVGVPAAFGQAFGAYDYFGDNAPYVHVIEGEGGLTAGRAHEALASAATSQLNNLVLHLDWNQASIDSDAVCRDGEQPGDYVQWTPAELAYFHDWNVIYVPDGFDFKQILAAQKLATEKINTQPTCIVYRTVKGWRYGIEGRASHGAGHKFCSEDFYNTLKPFEDEFKVSFPRLTQQKTEEEIESLYFEYLTTIRKALAGDGSEVIQLLGKALQESGISLKESGRKAHKTAPKYDKLFSFNPSSAPAELITEAGKETTLRGALGSVLHYLNHQTDGAVVVAAADLCGSTSISMANEGFSPGFWNAQHNRSSRLLSLGGICEDAMGAFLTGVSGYGKALGAGSSYGAFIAALQHVAVRLHCIGQQGKNEYNDEPFNPYVLVCAHAGLKTGEDGPTHADPQPLQLLQENFPKGSAITLTPWDPNELWPTFIAALNQRPALIAPFVTRPTERIYDRNALNLPPLEMAAKGVYAIREADLSGKNCDGTIVIQGSGVMNTFVEEVLPRIDKERLKLNIFYVTSVELFNALPEAEQEKIFPAVLKQQAMGITGFTLPTISRWIYSEQGRNHTLHPFKGGRFTGSGKAEKVLEEAGLNGPGQWEGIQAYLRR